MKNITISTRFILVYTSAVTFFLLYFILSSFKASSEDELSVKRINILNEDGTPFFVIANPEHTPPPVLNGVEYERQVEGGGATLYNQYGDERGGFVVLDDEERAMNAVLLDYKTTDAIGMFTKESADQKDHLAMLMVNDPDKERKIGHGVQRITVGTHNGNAGITINSTEGKPLLLIQVDNQNQIVFKTLDEEGNLIKDFID